jgi:hypothetical protein
LGELLKTLKQVFQAQVSAHTFVEGMFVQNHAENGSGWTLVIVRIIPVHKVFSFDLSRRNW